MTGLLDRLQGVVAAMSDGLSWRQLRVLLVMLSHSSSSGIAWPSTATIAERSGVDYRHVRRTLGDLVRMGLLRVVEEARGSRSRRYLVIPFADVGDMSEGHSSPRDGTEGATAAPNAWGPQQPSEEDPRGPPRTSLGGRRVPLLGAAVAPRTHQNTPEHTPAPPVCAAPEPAPASDGGGLDIALRDGILRDLRANYRITSANPFLGRTRVEQALRGGLTPSDLLTLGAEAASRANGQGPSALFWWSIDPDHHYRARNLLSERRVAQKERKARQRAVNDGEQDGAGETVSAEVAMREGQQ